MAGSTHTCVLADDHDAIRDGLRAHIERAQLAMVVAEARSGEQTLDLCSALRPSLAVLDLQMPGLSGVGLLTALRDRNLPTRVLVLSDRDDRETLELALGAGALGLISKECDWNVFVEAVRATLDNRRYIDPALASTLPSSPDPLSDRELQVLHLLADGCQNEEIAQELEVALETVKSHVSSLLKKLGARTRTDAVAIALRRAIIR